MKLIVASLIGIPGSGKTTFSRNLLQMSQDNSLESSVIVLSFDEHIQLDYSSLHVGKYKESREVLLKNVEHLITQLNANDQDHWEDILKSHEPRIDGKNFFINVNRPTLIILDDNMFFRSMRQRIRSICKNLNCRHFQIYFDISVDLALKRNSRRPQQVPSSVIQSICQRFEVPSNPRTIIINENLSCLDILPLIYERIENPETFADPQEVEVELKKSITHEMDIITRKELNIKIKSLQPSKNLSAICTSLNKKRKIFLENLKNRELRSFDENHVEPLRKEFIDLMNLSQPTTAKP